MAQKRDTIVMTFKRAGYRTIAVMPGLWQSWPEGAFYGFDEMPEARLEYLGPQFVVRHPRSPALAKFDAEEANVAPARRSSCSSRRSARTRLSDAAVTA
jgi:hypothetical protein